MNYLSSFLAGATLALTLAAPAWSAPAGANSVPTNITSNRMDYNAQTQTVVFSGDVHVTRPDFELWAATLTVYMEKRDQDDASAAPGAMAGMEAGNIDRIVAEKDVILKSENKEGRCDKGTYYAASDTFVMEGNPRLREDNNTISGKIITHYLGENRSEVNGAVNATFYAPDSTDGEGRGGGFPGTGRRQ